MCVLMYALFSTFCCSCGSVLIILNVDVCPVYIIHRFFLNGYILLFWWVSYQNYDSGFQHHSTFGNVLHLSLLCVCVIRSGASLFALAVFTLVCVYPSERKRDRDRQTGTWGGRLSCVRDLSGEYTQEVHDLTAVNRRDTVAHHIIQDWYLSVFHVRSTWPQE